MTTLSIEYHSVEDLAITLCDLFSLPYCSITGKVLINKLEEMNILVDNQYIEDLDLIKYYSEIKEILYSITFNLN